MAVGGLIESLLGGTTVYTNKSGNNSGGDKKVGGAREWIKNKLKALSQLLGKLADKALAALPGIIGSIHFYGFKTEQRIGWLVISEFVGIYNRC